MAEIDREILESILRFHKSLLEAKGFLSISVVYLEEQTVKMLEEYGKLLEKVEKLGKLRFLVEE